MLTSIGPRIGLTALLILCGCQNRIIKKQFDPPALLDETVYKKGEDTKPGLLSPKEDFIKKAIDAQTNESDRDAQGRFFDAGIAYSDAIIDEWFSAQFKADRKVNHNKGFINVIGNSAVGVLGLTGAEAKQLGLLGLTLAGINSEFDNFSNNFLIAPVLHQVKKKLDEVRALYSDSLRNALFPSGSISPGYSSVSRTIQKYHQLASRIEIQSIISRSVDVAKFEIPDQSKPATNLKASVTNALLIQLELELEGEPKLKIDPNTAIGLYITINGKPMIEKADKDLKALESRAEDARGDFEKSEIIRLKQSTTVYNAYASIPSVKAVLERKPGKKFEDILTIVGPYLNADGELARIFKATPQPASAAPTSTSENDRTSISRTISNTPRIVVPQ